MRGGFVACIGADGTAIDQVAQRLRWHRGGKPLRTGFRGFELAAFADSDGPFVSQRADSILMVHGEANESLTELEHSASRFAALQWDGSTLRASRDPMGLAPLFYRQVGPVTWFASEVHPLLGLAPATVDMEALAARGAFVPFNERTGWTGIFRVLPGSALEFSAGAQPKLSFHWNPKPLLATYGGSRKQAMDTLRQLLKAAVARCHVPGGGIILSGGIDSAAVCLASRNLGPAHLVNAYFQTNAAMDERQYARAIAGAVGWPLTEVACVGQPWDFDTELERTGLVYNRMGSEVYERASAHFIENGISSAMDGHDGDGVIGHGGGEWGALLAAGALRRLGELAADKGAARVLRGVVGALVPPRLRRREPTYLQRVARYFGEPLRSRILEADLDDWRLPGAQWGRRQLQPLIPEGMVSYEQIEQESARCGIDIRHPFADRALIAFMISLPCAIKSEPGRHKGLVVDAFGDLMPPVIRTRPKSGSIPLIRTLIDAPGAARMIHASNVRLPHVDYDRLFADAKAGRPDLPFFFIANFTRFHAFARLAAQ